MKLVRLTKTPKDYNGISYNEYKLYCVGSNGNICITTTGKVNVLYLAEDGTVLDDTKLDKVTLNIGDDLTFWRDDLGKLVQIDILVLDNNLEAPLTCHFEVDHEAIY